MKRLLVFLMFGGLVVATSCGGSTTTNQEESTSNGEVSSNETVAEESVTSTPETYDPKRGEGKFTAENVIVGEKLDVALATSGEQIAGVKCTSCHKTTDEKLVGPGWAGVTKRRTASWIMNFISNPDPMIEKDPELQAQLELCLVRMPNQGLNEDEARQLYEYMRKIDGVK